MRFVEIIWEIKTKYVSLLKIRMLVQIFSELLPQLCSSDSIQILVKMAWFLTLGRISRLVLFSTLTIKTMGFNSIIVLFPQFRRLWSKHNRMQKSSNKFYSNLTFMNVRETDKGFGKKSYFIGFSTQTCEKSCIFNRHLQSTTTIIVN